MPMLIPAVIRRHKAFVGSAPADPDNPVVTPYIPPAYALPTGGTTWTPTNATDLQTAFTNCASGDVIVLASGTTYEGQFTFPAKAGSSWIYVISDDMASIPAAGTRVTPADASHMPLIRSANNESHLTLSVHPGAKYVRFCGLEIAATYSSTSGIQYGIIRVGWDSVDSGALIGSPADNIVFDRCYVHGTATGNNRDGFVTYNVVRLAIVNSHVDNIHGVGTEAHGIQVYNSPGPCTIDNNRIEAAGINVFIGDNGSGLNPCDIRITRNYLFKPLTWKADDPSYAGVPWLVKNLLEIKAGHRILIEGNRGENSWVGGQHGDAFIITPRGGAVGDVTIRRNVARQFERAMTINNADVTLDNVIVKDNIFSAFIVGGTYMFYLAGTPGSLNNVTIHHNTMVKGALSNNGFISFYGSVANEVDGLSYKNNIVPEGAYGVFGNNKGTGFTPADFYCADYDFLFNLVTDGTPSFYTPDSLHWDDWLFSSLGSVGFTDTAFDAISDYKLTTGSTYHNAGDDGKDLGADLDAILAAMAPGDVF